MHINSQYKYKCARDPIGVATHDGVGWRVLICFKVHSSKCKIRIKFASILFSHHHHQHECLRLLIFFALTGWRSFVVGGAWNKYSHHKTWTCKCSVWGVNEEKLKSEKNEFAKNAFKSRTLMTWIAQCIYMPPTFFVHFCHHFSLAPLPNRDSVCENQTFTQSRQLAV